MACAFVTRRQGISEGGRMQASTITGIGLKELPARTDGCGYEVEVQS